MSDRRPPSDDRSSLPTGMRRADGSDLPPTDFGARSPRRPTHPSELFAAGEVLAGRYRILRFVAAGGAGEVYEAEDRELGERVAVKALHPAVADGAGSLDRFKREIHLARQVTHPNVCRIFDVGRHAPEGGPETYFLTMEFLEGETLSELVRERGRLTPEEALPIARQLAAALAAAHREGVVHRDFKSGNVMLVPDEREEGGRRAVVTDFGLARGTGGRWRHDTLTSGAEMVGTPGYMAPEQVEGAEVTPRSDLYAFGVVLYEMTTGEWPFTGDTPLSVAAKRLRQPPAPPRRLVPDLPEHWNATILRCLALEPRDRFARPEDVVAALEGRLAPRSRAGRRVTAALLAVAVLAVLAVLAAFWARQAPAPETHELEAALRSSLTPVQLTTEPGLEIDPAFSPDDQRLAFASDASGRFEIYVRSLAPGARDVRITDSTTGSLQPAWSPDGSRLLYTSGDGGLFVIPALGGVPRRLTAFGSRGSWSPDGDLIAFQEDFWPQTAVNVSTALPPSTLWLVPATGGEPRRLTRPGEPQGGHGAPTWSPDGERILFTTSDRTGSEAWTVRADGTDLAPIESELVRIYEPRFLGRDDWILATGLRREAEEGIGLWALQRSEEDGSYHVRSLAMPGVSSLRQLTVSPDGRRLAFTAMSTRSNLEGLDLDPETGLPTADPRPLTEGSGRNTRPSFSPDGDRLVFERWRTGVRSDLWQMELATGALEQITLHDATDAHGRWFPDGQRIGFLSARGKGLGFYVVTLPGGTPARVYGFETEIDWARLSPDGRRIAYHDAHRSGSIDIWVRDLDAGSARQLTGDPRREAFPVWSPDGRWLAYQVQSGEDSLLRMVEVSSGRVRELDGGLRLHFPYSFSPDGRRLAFAGFDGAWNLWWIDVETGARQEITDLPPSSGYVRYPAWSPRGDLVIYERAETAGDLWLVDELLASPDDASGASAADAGS